MADQVNNVLQGAIPVVLILITIAFVLGVGSQVISKSQDIYDTEDSVITITNESFTAAFNVATALTNSQIDNSSVVVSNSTGNYAQGLWEMGENLASFGQINLTTSINDGQSLNVSYDFTSSDKNVAFNASESGLEGLSTFSGFQPTFAIIAIAVLVIAVLMIGFLVVGGRITG